MKNIKNVKIQTIFFSILALILAYVVVIGIMIYGFGMNNNVIQKTARIIPYPGVILGNGTIITLSEINSKIGSIRMFYGNQDFSSLGLRVDFSTDEGKKRLLIKEKDLINKLIENRIIEKLANIRGIKITDDMVAQEVSRKLQEYGSGDYLKNTMLTLYGWQISDFEKNIVKPDLYKEKLKESVVQSDESFVKARENMKKAQDEIKNGKSFEETAKKYSIGESGKNGGELGWFSYDQIIPEVGSAAYIMKKGDTSDIIESSLGYHIINIEDKKTEENKEQVRIKQIFIKTTDFGDWLNTQMKSFKVFIPIKGFIWNKEQSGVDFTKDDMKAFEQKEFSSPSGDASVLF